MSGDDEKRSVIHAAAIAEFSERGFRGTSMANIAEAAGMSRPALYQYFADKSDIFHSAFVSLLSARVDAALGALEGDGGTAEQIDGFLQSFDGDLWERMAASPHSEELVGAKQAQLAGDSALVVERLWAGLARYLSRVRPGRGSRIVEQRQSWLEVLQLSPKGFKIDQPSIDVYRNRLRVLARSVAADIDHFSS